MTGLGSVAGSAGGNGRGEMMRLAARRGWRRLPARERCVMALVTVPVTGVGSALVPVSVVAASAAAVDS